MLRAILSKRESLLNSIKSLLSPAPDSEHLSEATPAPPTPETSSQFGRTIASTVAEIAAMDEESQRILRERAEKVAAEIQKLKAGKTWRESCPKWK